MIIQFPKLYRFDHNQVSDITIPFKKGEALVSDTFSLTMDGNNVPFQSKVTATHEDGSIKYLLVSFLCALKGNEKASLEFKASKTAASYFSNLKLEALSNGFKVTNSKLSFEVCEGTHSLFKEIHYNNDSLTEKAFCGPSLNGVNGLTIDSWSVLEEGPVRIRLKAQGHYRNPYPDDPCEKISFVATITLTEDSSDLDISFRLINSSSERLKVSSLTFAIGFDEAAMDELDYTLSSSLTQAVNSNSTGCDDTKSCKESDGIIKAVGLADLPSIASRLKTPHTMVGRSNYKTSFSIGTNAESLDLVVNADSLIGEANEHFAETLYGTFFADYTGQRFGVTATVYQAMQNYPKAVKAASSALIIYIIPEGVEDIAFAPGMSRTQSFRLHFHDANEPIETIDDNSLRYQMPDRPFISPAEFKAADFLPDIFVDEAGQNADAEIMLIAKADSHARAYGMLNWGDVPDMNYTTQGRGGGNLVWSNNEYDYPHAAALLYMKTSERRFLDYMLVSAEHWMDVDVCHYSKDPLYTGGQWEHSKAHCENSVMVCSHEWVEGLLDYYHFTGNQYAYDTAIGIGENVLRLLETPMYQVEGESTARETGWALRSLTALYVETHDEKWLAKCEWIVDKFKAWQKDFGAWMSPYTDNTLVRVPFMTSVAIGSLMRYYRVKPSESLKKIIVTAIDDCIENCMLPCGLFYYKELPSLNRLGNNNLLLEALACGYELTGQKNYLEKGLKTFERTVNENVPKGFGAKKHIENAVLTAGDGTKSFAQGLIPLATFYSALVRENMI